MNSLYFSIQRRLDGGVKPDLGVNIVLARQLYAQLIPQLHARLTRFLRDSLIVQLRNQLNNQLINHL